MVKKVRIDELAVLQGLVDDVEQARRLIMAGEVRSGDHVWEKAGEKASTDTLLELKGRFCRWVSRGGLKLEKAIADFDINPAGWRCLDIGASTGGFTDVLLHNSAARVVALDVGYGLLNSRLQNDPRVTVRDRTNFRTLADDALGEPFDLIVTDVSFISLTMILPKAARMLKSDGMIVALIKPQFEAERSQVPEGGVITEPQTQVEIIRKLKQQLQSAGLELYALAPVPRVSARKNIEFLSLWKTGVAATEPDIEKIVAKAHSDNT
ncbi:MAG TPA: TlyA family RNA methyltransferase [Candidatus Ozemobacteraceae bacterium]|nr:TlyA family RNA methyltransferase [Candidatus Ozemobacteraceae bacterium]